VDVVGSIADVDGAGDRVRTNRSVVVSSPYDLATMRTRHPVVAGLSASSG
jgi:hypothetical protein